MAAAGLWTTPSDLALFATDLQRAAAGRSNQVLSPKMAREMLTAQSGRYGLGVALDGEGKRARFSHSGANEGFRCHLIAYVESGQRAVVMTNSDRGGGLAEEIIRSVAREYAWPD